LDDVLEQLNELPRGPDELDINRIVVGHTPSDDVRLLCEGRLLVCAG